MLEINSEKYDKLIGGMNFIADQLDTEIQDYLILYKESTDVRVHVATLNEMRAIAASPDTHKLQKWDELPSLIKVQIACHSQNISEIEAILNERLTIIEDFPSKADVQGCYECICLVPEHALPRNYAPDEEFPKQFKLTANSTRDIEPSAATLPFPSNEEHARTLREVHSDIAKFGNALVLKGGGAKGLAYAGAIEVLERDHNYDWFIGTSAGAIAAVLLGAGFNATELAGILKEKDFTEFLDAKSFTKYSNLMLHGGIHPAKTFTQWIDKLLATKLQSATRVRLSDLPNRVTVFASRAGKRSLKFDPIDNDVDAAHAVRCSMSIPYFFVPQQDQGYKVYDGGIQYNYPLDELLREYPNASFTGLYLGSEIFNGQINSWVFSDLISIATEATDHEMLRKHKDRTIVIDPTPVGTFDFGLSDNLKNLLIASGRYSALKYLYGTENEETKSEYEKLSKLRKSVADAVKPRKPLRKLVISVLALVVAALIAVLVRKYLLR